MEKINEYLAEIYGSAKNAEISRQLVELFAVWQDKLVRPPQKRPAELAFNQLDAVVITYGDQFRQQGATDLRRLREFSERWLKDVVSTIHILPFCPYSSDDGFSVIDYRQVNPDWGSWQDIVDIGHSFRFMGDLVLNHCSVQSDWFSGFLEDDAKYRDYFITVDKNTDLSAVVRPRALPLLNSFQTRNGQKWLWCTFSADQVDINWANPQLFLEMVDIMLLHIAKGVQIIRLDAIAYLWKEIGGSCIHHYKTHTMVKLLRAIVGQVAPWVALITETNVPHEQNISYFGNGRDEAQMVYNFSLPPLLFDAFLRGKSNHLQKWLASLPQPDGYTTFFNFAASHDGIGMTPTHGILSAEEQAALVEACKKRGGLVSYKSLADGSQIPYELNISYMDAIAEAELPTERRVAKFLASQSLLLTLPGVPGIYIHSLLGSGNWTQGAQESGINRRINRQKFSLTELEEELNAAGSRRALVYAGYKKMLTLRQKHVAFDPRSPFKLHDSSHSVLIVERIAYDKSEQILAVINLTNERISISLPPAWTAVIDYCRDLLTETGELVSLTDGRELSLVPFQVVWLLKEK